MPAATQKKDAPRRSAGPAARAQRTASPGERVFILAPVGRDARLAKKVLTNAGFTCTTCDDAHDLPEDVSAQIGALLLTEEALDDRTRRVLTRRLSTQPAWSEVPVVIFVDRSRDRRERLRLGELLQPGNNVTVLGRPLRTDMLTSIVTSVLRDRQRQYQVRDLVSELQSARGALERRVAERTADLEERTKQARSLAASLTTAEQKERKRIAQVLHDELQQLLYGFRMRTQMLQNGLPPEKASDVLDQMDATAEAAIDLTRSLTTDLNPPVLDTEGFGAALRWLGAQMKERYELQVERVGGHPGPVPRRELRILLFRLVRELLFNVARHADTDRATITLHRRDGLLTIDVEDEGIGFDPERIHDSRQTESGFGLSSMQKRLALFDGHLEIDAAPGAGTRVTLSVPIDESAPS